MHCRYSASEKKKTVKALQYSYKYEQHQKIRTEDDWRPDSRTKFPELEMHLMFICFNYYETTTLTGQINVVQIIFLGYE